jgi:cell shape-determining protein MreC
MFLKNWLVIIVLAAVGLALGVYWLNTPTVPDGVTPQGDEQTPAVLLAALAGAVTTISGSVFGVLGKINDYKKARQEIEEKEIELAQKRKALNEQ